MKALAVFPTQRQVRSALTTETAQNDLGTRNLFAQGSFYQSPGISPWYQTAGGYYNPWTNDTMSYGASSAATVSINGVVQPAGNYTAFGPGLPVVYDPLWRCMTGVYPDPIHGTTTGLIGEARFGSGIGFIRPDPFDNGVPSAHGLQRITNFNRPTATINGQTVPIMPAAL